MKAKRCPVCGVTPETEHDPPPILIQGINFCTWCPACYDEDSIMGFGTTPEASITDWNSEVEDWKDGETNDDTE